jgi:uncharacterized protein
MKPVFADTSYFIALLSPTDAAYEQAVEYAQLIDRFVTTEWTLLELADGLSDSNDRPRFLTIRNSLLANPMVEVVPLDMELHLRAIELYNSRSDKEWSLTDCVSFVVMGDHKMTEALTTDRHFEQAGFQSLLKVD